MRTSRAQERLCEWRKQLWAVIGYRDSNFRISISAMRARRAFHPCSVCRVIGHNFALLAMVGIIPPMEPTIESAWAGRGEKCSLGRPLRAIRHTVGSVVALGSCHTCQLGCQLLNLGIPGVGIRSVGSEDDESVGASAFVRPLGCWVGWLGVYCSCFCCCPFLVYPLVRVLGWLEGPLAAPEKGEAGSVLARWSRIFSRNGKRASILCCKMAGYWA
jgi:hypothetical protein